MAEPLVSICIPAYNGEPFLQQCLQSCMAQTFTGYEIVVCDDGSTDGTAQIIRAFAANDARIRFVQNPQNLGLVGNWNKCIGEARGQWIKFVFQDDYISADCLQEFVAAIEKDTRLIVSRRHFILPADASEDVKEYYSSRVRTLENTNGWNKPVFPPALLSRLAVENMGMNFIGEPSLLFFRKDVTGDCGMFNPALKQICDLEFALRVASKYGLRYIPKQLCAFRIHGQTTTNTNITHRFYELRYIEPLLLSYFLLYDAHFKALRRSLGLFLYAKLFLYFRLRAYQANTVNKQEGRDHYLFRDGQTVFKEINAARNGDWLVRTIAKVL